MKNRIPRAAAVVACLALPLTAAAANQKGAYAFAGIGMTSVDAEHTQQSRTVERDANGTSLRAGLGYRWSRHVAVEADGHSMIRKADLGSLGRVGSYGMRAAVVGIVPMGERMELFGKLSAGTERMKWSRGIDRDHHSSVTTWDVGIGVGARYWLTPGAAVRMDIDGLANSRVSGKWGRDELSSASISLGFQRQF